MPKKPKQPAIRASATAKIEASAKAKWSRERVALEFIPPDVTRANSRALLDIFSPITQAAGLIGDRLMHKREMLKLEREQERQQAIDQVADRFNALRDQTKSPAAPPNKFLYPFIAQASLEEPNSPLIEVWASLLASATDHYDPRYIHFVSVISRFSARQAEIFTEIVSRASDSHSLELAMDDSTLVTASGIRSYIADLFDGHMQWEGRSEELTDDYLCECVSYAMDSPIISCVHAAAANETASKNDQENDHYYDILLSDLMVYKDDQEIDYAILVACGLLERVDTDMFPLAGGRWSLRLSYYHLTTLGQHFGIACQMVPTSSS